MDHLLVHYTIFEFRINKELCSEYFVNAFILLLSKGCHEARGNIIIPVHDFEFAVENH